MADAKVRMDRSRDYATVHGERAQGDLHAMVQFVQDGLPFDAQGFLIADHPDVTGNPKLSELAERKLKKAIKQAASAPGDDPSAPSIDPEGNDEDAGPLNLEAWARGEKKYPWQEISNAIAQRFTRRVQNKQAAIVFLVEEKVVEVGNLSDEHRKLVRELV